MPETEHRKPVRLAAAALSAAIDNDWLKATRAVQRLHDECAGDGLWTALVGWCDTWAEYANGGPPEFDKVQIGSWNVKTGVIGGELPERMRWAHRLIQARVADDEHGFTALVGQLGDIGDGFERGRYISALLESIALTMRSLPRGYARMGQGGTDA